MLQHKKTRKDLAQELDGRIKTNFTSLLSDVIEIMEQELYRELGYVSFHDYCSSLAQFFSRTQATRFEKAATTWKSLMDAGVTAENMPSQNALVELSRVPSRKRKAVLEQAAENGSTSPAEIKAAVRLIKGKEDEDPEASFDPEEFKAEMDEFINRPEQPDIILPDDDVDTDDTFGLMVEETWNLDAEADDVTDSVLGDDPTDSALPATSKKRKVEHLTAADKENRKQKIKTLMADTRDFVAQMGTECRSLHARGMRTDLDDPWYKQLREDMTRLGDLTGKLEVAVFELNTSRGGASHEADEIARAFCEARQMPYVAMTNWQKKEYNTIVSIVADKGNASVLDALAGYLYRLENQLEKDTFSWRTFLWPARINDWLNSDQARRASRTRLNIERLDGRLSIASEI